MIRLISLTLVVYSLALGQVQVGGDLSGSQSKPTVIKIQNVPVSKPTTEGSCPKFLSGAIVWSPSYCTSGTSSGTVAWTDITGRPTALSSFTNDLGFVTAAGTVAKANALTNAPGDCPAGQYFYGMSASGTPKCGTPAGTGGTGGVTDWANITNKPTSLSAFTNDPGFITASATVANATAAVTAQRLASTPNPCPTGKFVMGMTAAGVLDCGTPDLSGATVTSLPWTSITGRPTALSQFTNDAGFITTVPVPTWGQISGRPTKLSQFENDLLTGTVIWDNISNKPTALSQFTNDVPFVTSTLGTARAAYKLAADPDGCPQGQFATGINEYGVASCGTPNYEFQGTIPWGSITAKPPIEVFTDNPTGRDTWRLTSIKNSTVYGEDATFSIAGKATPRIAFVDTSVADPIGTGAIAQIGYDQSLARGLKITNRDGTLGDLRLRTLYADSVSTTGGTLVTEDAQSKTWNIKVAAVAGGVAGADQWTGTRTLSWTYGGDPNAALTQATYTAAWVNSTLTNARIDTVGCTSDSGTASIQIVEATGSFVIGAVTCTTSGASTAANASYQNVALNGKIGLNVLSGATAKSIAIWVKYTPTY